MKKIKTEDAVGTVLCHDLTRIVPGVYKDAQFRKGHIITAEDVPMLLSMGKEHLFVYEKKKGFLHENEAAERLCAICISKGMTKSEVKEGKIELRCETDGLFTVQSSKLVKINSIGEIMIASIPGNMPVHKGDKLCGTRIIPLVINEKKIEKAEKIADGRPLFSVLPYKIKTAAIVTTGSEVFHGRIEDAFTPVVIKKLEAYGVKTVFHRISDDGAENVMKAIAEARGSGAEFIICTGGMSVDADDNTPQAIRKSGAEIVTYGAPVLPGAMFLFGYFDDGVPVAGLPGCVMYARTTVFDIVLPRILAGVKLTRRDFAVMGEGGLCRGCAECRYPDCSFGK